jgi:DNA (cytosine-5)-methyltransferase 1
MHRMKIMRRRASRVRYDMLTHFSLFTGIGGLDIAAEWAGFTTVGQCEWADYPTKVLEKHWPEVPRWRDIREVTAESVRNRGIGAIDVISGGFPCQPFSVAGNQKGKEDDRYLWPEMLRVIRELAPRWVIGENVPGILSIAADDVCKDLEREGYEVGIFDFEAASVGAPHRRERIFFVAHTNCNSSRPRGPEPTRQQRPARFTNGCINMGWNSNGRRRSKGAFGGMEKGEDSESSGICADVVDPESDFTRGLPIGKGKKEPGFGSSCQNAPDTDSKGFQTFGFERQTRPGIERGSMLGAERIAGWWAVEPNVGRVAHGIPARVDRLKCLGNAVVPQQAYPLFMAIADILNGVAV